MIKSCIFALIHSCAARDSAIGVTSWGTVKVPSYPVSIEYPKEEQEMMYNILVSSNMASSPKKVVDGIAVDLSKTKWPQSGKPMFNVTLLTDQENKKAMDKKSDTFHPYMLDYKYS